MNKMKLSKTAWWILGIGFFIIASAVLVAFFSGQSGDAEQLEENLTVTQTVLATLVADREEMSGQLAQLENQLDEAATAYSQSKAKFPELVASIEYDEEIFSIANDSNLQVLSITASEPQVIDVTASEPSENEEEILFANTIFTMEVQGTVSNILTFIDDVATGGYFNSATVELINLEIPEIGQDEEPTAAIKIIIYSYEGE